MDKCFDSSIEQFIDVFNTHLNFIKNKDLGKSSSLYKKLICVCIIDCLGSTVLPDLRSSNKEKYIKFIEDFSPNSIWEKVSLPHLFVFFEKINNHSLNELEKIVKNKMKPVGSPQELKVDSFDLPFNEIEPLWSSNLYFNKLSLSSFKHSALFYNYRNYIVHELRRPGGIFDDDLKHNRPFYYEIEFLEDGSKLWRLVYPLGFFVRVCEDILHNTKEYLEEKQINPYENNIFDSGNYFIPILNK